jgi:putative addiction module component (TIGR02574 family)
VGAPQSRYNLPMQPSFEEVEKLALALPEDQRIRLANSLYESISDEEQASEAEIESAWGDEIKRRLDEIDSGKVKMISHEEFLAQLDAHIASKRQK